MALSEAKARTLLALVIASIVAAACMADIPRLSDGRFWSDGATYYGMAWSLAEDGDLRYEARDAFRARREFSSGLQGVFLKRTAGGWGFDPDGGFPWIRRVPHRQPVYFAKAFAYPMAVAPLVRVFGTRGMLLGNAIALGVALWLGYVEIRRRTAPAAALAATVALFLLTVAPIYVLWPTPEVFNLGVITAGLVAWRRGHPMLSAVLLGIATYSKPYNLFVALPLGVAPLLPLLRRRSDAGIAATLGESVKRGAVLAGVVVLLFGLNAAITGEVNYQGGERKTFYGTLPFEAHGVTFGNSGIWMTTDSLGPLVEGRDEEKTSRRTGPLRDPGEIRASFLRNLGYFWIGRFGGAFAYFCPALLAVLLFLARGPRDADGWLAFAALVVSYVFYIRMIPDNWYGGAGTIGNRYFLNLLPLALFLVPVRQAWTVAAGGVLGAVVFLSPILLSPMAHSLRPGDHAMRGPFMRLPAELTMLNDLAVFTEPWRKKQAYGDVGGPDRPAQADAYVLYFMDDGTHGREESEGRAGFRVRAGRRTEVVLRVFDIAPVERVLVSVSAGVMGDVVRITLGGRSQELTLGPGETRTAALEPGAGFPYYDTFLHVLTAESKSAPSDERAATEVSGPFVSLALETAPARPADRAP